MFRPGDTVGSYTIMRKLGAGGMGQVYLAEHQHIARKAAIKVLLPELSSRQELVARLFNEARATSLIRHPGIVEILDCGVHPNGQAFIVMELLEGESLTAWLRRRGKLGGEPALAASLIGQIASAIGAAHDQEIIHRDIKPDNLFVLAGGPAPSIKVLDFGVAKLAVGGSGGNVNQTAGGAILGTPIYMSPEQCRGTGKVDRRSDIYSLGCVAFELLTGQPPFVRAGAGEFIIAHLTEPPPAVQSLEPGVPAPLGELVARMLAKDPGGRPQNMAQVVRALLPLVSGSGGAWAGWAATRTATPQPAATTPPPPAAPRTMVLPTAATPAPPPPAVDPPPMTTLGRSAWEIRVPTLRQGGSQALKRIGIAAGAVVLAFALYAAFSSHEEPGERGQEPPARETRVVPVAPRMLPGAPDVLMERAPGPQRAIPVEIASDPPGAEVWVADEGASRGRTPLAVTTGDLPLPVRVRSPGYLERTLALTASDAPRVEVTLEKIAVRKMRRPPPPPSRPRGYIKIED
jgi:eukaryotic-like serine/threonine-protein kinase